MNPIKSYTLADTAEQLKAIRKKYKYCEIPMKYRNRIGVSKVSGTVKGTIFAGIKIIGWIVKYGYTK